jgi:hypothetical protein
LATALLAGCGGHDSKFKGSTTAPVTTAPVNTNNGATTTLDVAAVPSATQARVGPDIVALALSLTVAGSNPAEVSSLSVAARGTLDESTGLGGLKLVGDDNQNGQIDAGEPVLATVAAPAFAVNDGSVSLALAQPIQIAPGASLRLLVAVDASATGAAAAAKVGKTIELQLVAAGDLVATAQSQPLAPQGSFPLSGGPITLFLHDHLLISEVVTQPTTSEYVELFNPTAAAIDLSNYYLTDHTVATAPIARYHLLPTGTGFAPASTTFDVMVRFPAGATIPSGGCVVVALDGTTFQTAFSKAPEFVLRNPVGAAQQMLQWSGTAWTPTAVPAVSGTTAWSFLSNTTEPVLLIHWNGQSDLVQDVDYVFWGNTAATNSQPDKTGLSVDGPDADTAPSSYLPDTAPATQMTRTAPAPPATGPSGSCSPRPERARPPATGSPGTTRRRSPGPRPS